MVRLTCEGTDSTQSKRAGRVVSGSTGRRDRTNERASSTTPSLPSQRSPHFLVRLHPQPPDLVSCARLGSFCPLTHLSSLLVLTFVGLPTASWTSTFFLVIVQSSFCSISTRSAYIRDSGIARRAGRGGRRDRLDWMGEGKRRGQRADRDKQAGESSRPSRAHQGLPPSTLGGPFAKIYSVK